MKKIILFLLIIILLFNTTGYFIAFKAVQYSVKKEIKNQIRLNLSSDELTAITINKSDLNHIQWKENGREMMYQNELYDIVKSTETITCITYYCINDKKEKLLFANLDEHINMYIASDKPLKNSASKKLSDHVVKLYFMHEQLFQFDPVEKSRILYSAQKDYTPVLIETNSPPPEFA